MKKQIKVLAVICFWLIIAALLTALISDGIIIGRNIFGFALALFVSAIVLFAGTILFFISYVLIFGIYLGREYGFWPVAWAKRTFQEVIADYAITIEQIHALLIIRIVLVVICVVVLIMSFVITKQVKAARKKDPEVEVKPTRGFAKAAFTLSLLGTLVGAGALGLLIALS